MRLTLTLAAAVAFGLGGCETESKGGHTSGSHDLPAKHGGQVVHLADHGPAMEIVFDENAGTITLHAYNAEGETQKLDEAPVANIEKGPTQVTGKGAEDKWTFTHENLKGHPHVKFVVKVGGVKYNNGEWHPGGH